MSPPPRKQRLHPSAPTDTAEVAPPPTTIAVAVDYLPGESELPRVVATGRGHIAEQILELAFAHGVKVRQDADLAQILAAVDVDTDIPVEAFAAVSEILAYVYQANRDPEGLAALAETAFGKMARGGPSRAMGAEIMRDTPSGSE